MNGKPIKALLNRYCIWPLALRTTRRHPRILAYHRFSRDPTERKLDEAAFRRQLEVIRHAFQPVTFGELLTRDPWVRRQNPPLAVVTVDDGYADFYDIAWPALRDAGIPATVFVTVDFIEGRRWLWPDALEYVLFTAEARALTLASSLGELHVNLMTPATRSQTWNDIATRLIFENEARTEVLTALESALGVRLPGKPTEPYAPMSWDQLRELSAAGIEIGSHTMSHSFTAGLPPEQRRYELTESKRVLEEKLGVPVESFAYPNGLPADAPGYHREEVRAARYRAAALCYPPSGGTPDIFGIERWTTSENHTYFLNVMHGASLLRRRLSSRAAPVQLAAASLADG